MPFSPLWFSPSPDAGRNGADDTEAAEVTDRVAFFNERVDLAVDGVRLERPVTPWSPR